MICNDFYTKELSNGEIILFVDSSSQDMQFAVFNQTKLLAKNSFCGNPVENMFDCVKQLLNNNNIALESISGIVISIGPGSTIGIRAACALASTLKILQKINNFKLFTFNSMHLAQVYIHHIQNVKPPIHILAKANTTQVYHLLSDNSTTLAPIYKENITNVPNNSWWLKSNLLQEPCINTFMYNITTLFDNLKNIPNVFCKTQEIPDVFKIN